MADRSAARLLGNVFIALNDLRDSAIVRDDLVTAEAMRIAAVTIFDAPDMQHLDFSYDQMGDDAVEACLDLGLARKRLTSEVEPVPPGSLPWYDEGDMTIVYRGETGWD